MMNKLVVSIIIVLMLGGGYLVYKGLSASNTISEQQPGDSGDSSSQQLREDNLQTKYNFIGTFKSGGVLSLTLMGNFVDENEPVPFGPASSEETSFRLSELATIKRITKRMTKTTGFQPAKVLSEVKEDVSLSQLIEDARTRKPMISVSVDMNSAKPYLAHAIEYTIIIKQ